MKKIGILGGGQLGRMFAQAASNYPYEISFLDPDPNAPCKSISQNCHIGDFNCFEDVITFGKDKDIISIEIEHINTQALFELESSGKTVIPRASVIQIIQDKGKQKAFYQKHQLNTAPFYLIDQKTEIDLKKIPLPFVQKLRTGGYDGKGVQVIKTSEQLNQLWDAPSVIEPLTSIAQEISIIVAKNQQGDIAIYDPVEMVFDHKLNLVDYLKAPANLLKSTQQSVLALTTKLIQCLDSAGIFAIEMFITTDNQVLINEIAPRTHNSGHGTIEACYTSQFEQMFRILANLPLGDKTLREPYVMLNILGAPNHQGQAVVEGLDQVLQLEKVFFHWYGKNLTKPGRKMGHITLLGNFEKCFKNMQTIKQQLRIIN